LALCCRVPDDVVHVPKATAPAGDLEDMSRIPSPNVAHAEVAAFTKCVAVSVPADGAEFPRPRRRRFTPEQKRAALLVVGKYGGNLTRAAKELGLTVPLLARWRAIAAGRASR
jgi:hypothetical protein